MNNMETTALILTMLLPAVLSAQQKPTTGYAPINGLKMYYEIHGSGDPVVSLHGSFMTITNNLVKLPKTGALLLTGDLVHFQLMWDEKIVPPFNFDREQSLASIARVARLLAEHEAQLWIGHDKDLAARIDRAPKFYE